MTSFSLTSYFSNEVLGFVNESSENLNHIEEEVFTSINMINFISVPIKFERFIIFGSIVCMDGYLYILTYLPLRVLIAIVLFVCEVIYQFLFVFIIKIIDFIKIDDDNKPYKAGDSIKMKRRHFFAFFHRNNGYDLLRLLFILIIILLNTIFFK